MLETGTTMRLILTLIFFNVICVANAQPDEGLLKPKIIAIDTSKAIAKKFVEEVAKVVKDYKLVFVDSQKIPHVLYYYASDKTGNKLKISYRYNPENGKVIYQRISGELGVLVEIFNYLFGVNATYNEMKTWVGRSQLYSSPTGNHELITNPVDMEPGSWEIIFMK